MSARVIVGDALERLRELPDESVQCCVTSPPYWGLRDYGVAGQVGLERTPEEYVAKMVTVFREVRRVLAKDGTLWLNMGDSYVSSPRGNKEGDYSTSSLTNPARQDKVGRPHGRNSQVASRSRATARCQLSVESKTTGLKSKDLVGMPWRVAFALQQPYHTGTIRDERDRIWLAAMLDAEGCLFIQKRKAGQHNGQGYHRQNDNYGAGLEISNTHRVVVERIAALVGKGSICEQESGKFGRKQTLYRWNLRTAESREFVRELYPYLVAKQHQARLLYGCPSAGSEAEAAHGALKLLHQGGETEVDFPPTPSMWEPGFYLRSDIIWSKRNPMPESVTDRPTKAHEYMFLLSKAPTYYYDADAIAEPVAESQVGRVRADVIGGTSHVERGQHSKGGIYKQDGHGRRHAGFNARWDAAEDAGATGDTRNRRSVWTVATQPFSDAHFATFPPKLVEPCILAGSRRGDTILDPFGGAGTTGLVADRLGRNAILIELNPQYAAMAERRIHDDAPLFAVTSSPERQPE